MERKLRIAQYGCGKMSVYTMRYAMEKGAEIVCAFGRSPHNLGKDIGDIAGVGKTGVLVQDSKDAAAILKEKKPDACIITTASLMQDLKGPFMDCAESGVNAITLGEEAFYPWNSSYKTTQTTGRLGQEEWLYPLWLRIPGRALGKPDHHACGRHSHHQEDHRKVQLQR